MTEPKQGTLISGMPYDPRRSQKAFQYVVYPGDSLPDDWLDNLNTIGATGYISPLHDKDINTDNTPKKPHRHLTLIWNNPTKWQTAMKYCDMFNCPPCIPVANIKANYEYYTHKNNPEKHQYDPKDIIHIGGFNPLEYIQDYDTHTVKTALTDLIDEQNITLYTLLIRELKTKDKNGDFVYPPEYLEVAENNTIFFCQYIKGVWRLATRQEYAMTKQQATDDDVDAAYGLDDDEQQPDEDPDQLHIEWT